jgi:hypothetical protein
MVTSSSAGIPSVVWALRFYLSVFPSAVIVWESSTLQRTSVFVCLGCDSVNFVCNA